MTVHSGEKQFRVGNEEVSRLKSDNRVHALLRLMWKGEISLRDTASSIAAYGYDPEVVNGYVRASSFERVG